MFDASALLVAAGPWLAAVVFVVVFIESGCLFPFLPGDSLLFAVGMVHHHLGLPLPVLIMVAAVAAIGGDSVGYLIGSTAGRRWFTPDARILKTSYLEQTEDFFARRGGAALVLARFVPIVRTFTPLAAGAGHYRYRRFLAWNTSGGILWSVGVVLLGIWLGGLDVVANHIDAWMVAVVLVSVLLPVIMFLRHRRRSAMGSRDRGTRLWNNKIP
ncbi:VTT domain-containing protein [Micrococcaceae bacterium RIT802]|nr:VTT domain-containing protein [Micrococcaceae bacterium RIT 802]